jgi:hypothetical protein
MTGTVVRLEFEIDLTLGKVSSRTEELDIPSPGRNGTTGRDQ